EPSAFLVEPVDDGEVVAGCRTRLREVVLQALGGVQTGEHAVSTVEPPAPGLGVQMTAHQDVRGTRGEVDQRVEVADPVHHRAPAALVGEAAEPVAQLPVLFGGGLAFHATGLGGTDLLDLAPRGDEVSAGHLRSCTRPRTGQLDSDDQNSSSTAAARFGSCTIHQCPRPSSTTTRAPARAAALRRISSVPTLRSSDATTAKPGRAAAAGRFAPSRAMAGCAASRYKPRMQRAIVASYPRAIRSPTARSNPRPAMSF